jgi:hypothetical protein
MFVVHYLLIQWGEKFDFSYLGLRLWPTPSYTGVCVLKEAN